MPFRPYISFSRHDFALQSPLAIIIQRHSKVWCLKLYKKMFKKVIKKSLVVEGNRRRRRPEPVKLWYAYMVPLRELEDAACLRTARQRFAPFSSTRQHEQKSVLDQTHGCMQVTSHDRSCVLCIGLSSYKSRSVGYGSMATKRKRKDDGQTGRKLRVDSLYAYFVSERRTITTSIVDDSNQQKKMFTLDSSRPKRQFAYLQRSTTHIPTRKRNIEYNYIIYSIRFKL